MSESADDPELATLRAAIDPGSAFAELFEGFRPRIERAVSLRLDRRVRGRVDAADVVQETFLECARRLADYLGDPPAPLFLWARYLAMQRLLQLHRHHLGRARRDAAREISIDQAAYPGASSNVLAGRLVDGHTSPTRAARRAETKILVEAALEEMEELDREILVLRHFEQLSGKEAAEILGIEHAAARQRYVRALKRLRVILDGLE